MAVCPGIEINTVNITLRIPDDKLQEIQQIWFSYVSKDKVTNSHFHSFLGSLLCITKCVNQLGSS